jgi:RNA polymerase sigma factor (sigma-70 family)
MADTISTTLPEGRGLLAVFLECRSTLMRLVGAIVNRHDVDDILQEAFTRSYEMAGRTTIRNPRAFLLRTATNIALNHISSAGNRLTDAMEDLPLSTVNEQWVAESPEAQLDASQRFVLFCQAVGGLPPQCRQVFVLKKVYGLSQQEIAQRLGIAQSTIEKHIVKGLVACRKYMAGAPGAREAMMESDGQPARTHHEQ